MMEIIMTQHEVREVQSRLLEALITLNSMAKANPIEVQKYLKGIEYPITKQELIEAAQAQGANNGVIKTLRDIPGDTFNTANEVSEGIAEVDEDIDGI